MREKKGGKQSNPTLILGDRKEREGKGYANLNHALLRLYLRSRHRPPAVNCVHLTRSTRHALGHLCLYSRVHLGVHVRDNILVWYGRDAQAVSCYTLRSKMIVVEPKQQTKAPLRLQSLASCSESTIVQQQQQITKLTHQSE